MMTMMMMMMMISLYTE